MSKKEIKVKFNTITPLWTGDAWQDNREIRPSSLMGSLRFWFAFYWEVVRNGEIKHSSDGVPDDNLRKLEKPREDKTFEKLLLKNISKTNNFDEAIDKTLGELELPVPSRIFGCTGWKSRLSIKVENFEEEQLTFNELDFYFPINQITYEGRRLNTKSWIKRVLFKNNDEKPIKLFKNLEIKVLTTEYWWDKYLKDFFDFFKDKLILVGGKNSFGFGFVNLQYEDDDYNGEFQSVDNKLVINKIFVNYQRERKVLGFNFKYYLRKKDDCNEIIDTNGINKETLFGEQGEASKIYISNLLDDNSVYLLLINNPFSEIEIPQNIFYECKNLLESL